MARKKKVIDQKYHYFVIILYSAAIVAVGADEVHSRYLQGELGERSSARGASSSRKTSSVRTASRSEPNVMDQDESSSRDKLDATDRRALNDLIGEVGNE